MRKIHQRCTIPDGTPPHCVCGYDYPEGCGGHPILRPGTGQEITRLAAEGIPFAQIAEQTGESVHTVRQVVHRP